ncbi:MAG TPA: SDR family NAD(P)-dependent oxidoreductase [bacterium]|nr:SDR family NAD(P)-dependent oxidoreductase [bacterium]HPS29898.1 SDR family NAD(P)-dependent oxidoreductase [bacterium]
MINLKGRKALITGASSGFGVDFANILASKGMDLIIVARRKDKLDEVKKDVEKKHGVKVKVIDMDLAGFHAAEKLYLLTKDENIEVLLNNAGYGMYEFFQNQKAPELDKMLQLNIITLTALANMFLKDMVKKDSGYIMNVASFAGFNPTPFYAAYGASKAYVMNFSVALSTELKKTGSKVLVSAFCPGYTDTEFVSRAGQKRSKFVESTIGQSYPAAVEAVDGLFKGKAVVMPRFMNKLGAFMLKLMSRRKAAEAIFSSIGKD